MPNSDAALYILSFLSLHYENSLQLDPQPLHWGLLHSPCVYWSYSSAFQDSFHNKCNALRSASVHQICTHKISRPALLHFSTGTDFLPAQILFPVFSSLPGCGSSDCLLQQFPIRQYDFPENTALLLPSYISFHLVRFQVYHPFPIILASVRLLTQIQPFRLPVPALLPPKSLQPAVLSLFLLIGSDMYLHNLLHISLDCHLHFLSVLRFLEVVFPWHNHLVLYIFAYDIIQNMRILSVNGTCPWNFPIQFFISRHTSGISGSFSFRFWYIKRDSRINHSGIPILLYSVLMIWL